jgi:hypothetical protein
MRLDAASGAVEGEVVGGRFAGRALRQLDRAELRELLAEAGRDDPPSVALLEAYLDRREPGWRDAGGEPGAAAAAMDEATALAILGLEPGADAAAIAAAHRRLMAGLHPDKGGSTWLASQVNQARDLLMRRHRRGGD